MRLGDSPSSAPRQVQADLRLFLRRLTAVRRSGSWSMPHAVRRPRARVDCLAPTPTGSPSRTGIGSRSTSPAHLPLQRLPPRWCRAAARHDTRATSFIRRSCSMSCHAAFTASGITACSPVQHARSVLRVPASRLCRAIAGACGIARTIRSPPALSLLRRAHVLSRPSSDGGNPARHLTQLHQPGASLVTRHALRSSHAATPPLRRMRQYPPFATISATGLNMSRAQLPIHAPLSENSHSTSPPTPAPSRFRRHHSRAKLQIPIDHRRSPAGFVLAASVRRPHAPKPDP